MGDPSHPLVLISNELTSQFVLSYSQYTGVGAEYKILMSPEQKRAMFNKII